MDLRIHITGKGRVSMFDYLERKTFFENVHNEEFYNDYLTGLCSKIRGKNWYEMKNYMERIVMTGDFLPNVQIKTDETTIFEGNLFEFLKTDLYEKKTPTDIIIQNCVLHKGDVFVKTDCDTDFLYLDFQYPVDGQFDPKKLRFEVREGKKGLVQVGFPIYDNEPLFPVNQGIFQDLYREDKLTPTLSFRTYSQNIMEDLSSRDIEMIEKRKKVKGEKSLLTDYHYTERFFRPYYKSTKVYKYYQKP